MDIEIHVGDASTSQALPVLFTHVVGFYEAETGAATWLEVCCDGFTLLSR